MKKEILKAIPYHCEIYNREPSFLFFDKVKFSQGGRVLSILFFEKKRYYNHRLNASPLGDGC